MSEHHTVREVERAEMVARYSGCVALGILIGAAVQPLLVKPPASPYEVGLAMTAALFVWMLPAWWCHHRAEHSMIRRTR